MKKTPTSSWRVNHRSSGFGANGWANCSNVVCLVTSAKTLATWAIHTVIFAGSVRRSSYFHSIPPLDKFYGVFADSAMQ